MDIDIQSLLSFSFICFCLGVFAITFVFRKVVEITAQLFKNNTFKDSAFWRDLILPVIPIVTGYCIASLSLQYPYPDGFATKSGRIIFGLAAGLLSNLIYRMITANILNKISQNLPKDENVEDLTKKIRETIVQ